MSRLPKPGSDSGTWGDILNDYLNQEHNSDGTQKTLPITKGGTNATDASTARTNLGTISTTDSRLTDARIPTDGSVTDAKIVSGGLSPSKITGTAAIASDLTAKADDSTVVHKAGIETITGAKDFTGGATINSTNIVVTGDTRLTDARTPTDGSVTDAKITSGGLSPSKVTGTAVIKGELVKNVKDYGAVGNGTTDDSAAIQAAFDALPGNGGCVYFPLGQYKIVTGIVTTAQGVHVLGSGGVSRGESGGGTFLPGTSYRGAMLVAATSSMTLLSFDTGTTTTGQEGPVIEHLNFIDSHTGTSTLLKIRLMTHATVRNCSFRNGLYGIYHDSNQPTAGGDAAWALFEQNHFNHCTTCIWANSAALIMGGDFEIVANGVGIDQTDNAGPCWLKVIGVKMDGPSSTDLTSVGIHFRSQHSCVIGSGFESVGTPIIFDGNLADQPNSGRFNKAIGCGVTGGNTQYGIIVTNQANHTQLYANTFSGILAANYVADAGADTIWSGQAANPALNSNLVAHENLTTTAHGGIAVASGYTHIILEEEFLSGDTANNRIGALGWAIATGTVAGTPGELSHPGVLTLASGATANNVGQLYLAAPTSNKVIYLTDTDYLCAIVRPVSGSTNMGFRFGFEVAPATIGEGSQGAYWSFLDATSPNWASVTRDGSGVTRNATAVAYTTGHWYLLEIKRNGTSWEFWINNTLAFTHTTNIVNSNGYPIFAIDTLENVTKTASIDYFMMRSIATLGQRWT